MGSIFYFIDINSFIGTLKETKLVFVVLAMFVYLVGLFFGIIRHKHILNNLNKKIGILKLFGAHLGGMLASDITPGRTGYFVFPFLVKKEITATTGMSVIVSLQVFDFLFKVVSSIIGLIIIAYLVKLNEIILSAVLIGIFIVIIFSVIMMLALWSKRSMAVFKFGSKFPWIGKYILKFEDKIGTFQQESGQIKKILPQLLLLSIPPWFLKGLEWYLIGLAVGFGFPFWLYLFLQPLITIVQFVPITPAGLGLQEGGSIFIFVLLGATVESSLLFSFLSRGILILVDLLGLPMLLKRGINILKIEDD